MIVANMASYPARESNTLEAAVTSISDQVDFLNVCLNKYKKIPEFFQNYDNVNAFLPEQDYKDVGKFVSTFESDDDVFYVDDDIIYPRDYVRYLTLLYNDYQILNPVLGVHGVIYSDVFNGDPKSRNVFSFRTRLTHNRVVNQLGTGTVYCKGFQAPSMEYMLGSERYVDLRFARHAHEHNFPMVCVAREAGWLVDQQPDDSIFEGFTKRWPVSVVKEAQSICGYSKLSLDAVSSIEVG